MAQIKQIVESCLKLCDINVFPGPSTSSQPEQHQLENGQGSSLVPSPSSQPLSTGSCSSLRSPQLTPQISPDSQLCDPPSDNRPMEGCSPASSSAPHSDPQGSPTGGEEEVGMVEEGKDAKNNKKLQLHCPTCKVTVNSTSQLDAHCSGAYYMLYHFN